MSLEKALQRAGYKPTTPPPEEDRNWQPPNPEQVPMMYRAQVQGRCSLQYGKNNDDLKRWTEEWVYPDDDNQQKPFYQYSESPLGHDGSIYRLKITFPFRVFTNCGQDSILRPTIGVNGIPFIPGSSIKGLFQRLCYHPQVREELQNQVKDYCGTPENPGTLRFHGAYPVGDWAGTTTVKLQDQPEETRYRMVDVVHPQQQRQVQEQGSPKAIATISFYQPTFIFELSSADDLSDEQWNTIGGLLKRALRSGLGGKTSTGYGLYVIPQDRYPLSISLAGKGVSSLLRSDEPEFRPNLFKATLRGHLTRLFGGITRDENLVNAKINELFGHTTEPGVLQLYWDTNSGFPIDFTVGREETPSYEIEGTLYLDAPSKHLKMLQKLLQFTVIMAGLGKSWRRVWHEDPDFFPDYQTRGIGCHWRHLESNFDFPQIQTGEDLNKFLESVRQETCRYLGIQPDATGYQLWKEAWHPERLSVYSQVVSQSQGIRLFNNDKFKTTPAIGGRKVKDKRPTSFSYVWHRMLPINSSQYLEIITVFRGGEFIPRDYPGLDKWCRENSQGQEENQFPLFVGKLKNQGFQLTWGTEVDLNSLS